MKDKQKVRLKISCGVFDALSASYASVFCDYLFFSGLSISAGQFFEIDSGLHSIERLIALKIRLQNLSIAKPVIADIDDSFGDYSLAGSYGRKLEMNGFMGVVMEDQARPRKCGHKTGKILAPIHIYRDGLLRLRNDCPGLYVVARTDAETPEDIAERIEVLSDLACDGIINAVQVDGIRTLGEIASVKTALPDSVEFVANHVDGGRLVNCSFKELEDSGVDILTLSTYMLSSTISSLKQAVEGIREKGVIPQGPVGLKEIDALLQGGVV